jgi:hypothetical protein
MSQHTPRKPRFVVNQKVRVHFGTVSTDGMVVDLHEEGARLEARARLRVGDTVSLTICGAEVKARIAWSRDKAAGLSFMTPIATDLVSALHRETEGWISL